MRILEVLSATSDDKIDLALMNFLIVSDLPEYKNLSQGEFFQMLEATLDFVELGLARRRQDSKNSELKDPLDPIFGFASAIIALGIDYKEEFKSESITPEQTQKLYSDPDNIFLAGLLRSRRGSCVSMPMLYLVVGQKLEMPIHLVTIGRHSFVRWQQGEKWFNIETTITKQVAITDSNDIYLETEGLTPQKIKGTNALRNLTNIEVVGLMFAARAGCWTAKGAKYALNAYIDLTRANSLVPDDPNISRNKATIQKKLSETGAMQVMEDRITESLMRRKSSWERSAIPMPGAPLPSPFSPR